MIAATALPRVLHGASGRPLTLEQHEEAFKMSARPGTVMDQLEASGLTGRGGAAFPTFRKAAEGGKQISLLCVISHLMNRQLVSQPFHNSSGSCEITTGRGTHDQDICIAGHRRHWHRESP